MERGFGIIAAVERCQYYPEDSNSKTCRLEFPIIGKACPYKWAGKMDIRCVPNPNYSDETTLYGESLSMDLPEHPDILPTANPKLHK